MMTLPELERAETIGSADADAARDEDRTLEEPPDCNPLTEKTGTREPGAVTKSGTPVKAAILACTPSAQFFELRSSICAE